MTMPNRFRSRSGGRRRYQWMREASSSTEIQDGVSVGLIELTDAEILAEGLAAPTLVRVRGNGMIRMDPATSQAGFVQRTAVGIIVTASSVTAAEVSGPLVTPNLNWLYWGAWITASPSPTGSEEDVAPGFVRFDLDVKAMRKIHKSNVHVIVQNAGDSVAHVFVNLSLSFLFQE